MNIIFAHRDALNSSKNILRNLSILKYYMNIKIIVGFILGTVILIGGSYALLTLTDTASKIESSSNVKAIITSKTDHDWGTIGINDGKVSATYTIKNDGTEPL